MATEGASSKNTKEQSQKEHGIDCRASDSGNAFFFQFKTDERSGRMFVMTTICLLW